MISTIYDQNKTLNIKKSYIFKYFLSLYEFLSFYFFFNKNILFYLHF